MFYLSSALITLLIFVSGCTSKVANLESDNAEDLDVHIRYNLLGYSPQRPKKFVVMASHDLSGQPYFVVEEKPEGRNVVTGKISASVAGQGQYTPFTFNYIIDLSTVSSAGNYELRIGSERKAIANARFSVKMEGIDHHRTITEMLTHLRSTRSGTPSALYHPASHLEDAKAVIVREANKLTEVPDSFKGGLDLESGLYTTDSKYIWKREDEKVDMLGGWYDAGDYIKFTLTNAATAYFLLRAYDVAPGLFDGSRELSQTKLNDILDEAKFGLDYLLKVMPNDNRFIMQIGSEEDHNQGYRLPQNDTLEGLHRPAFSALVPQHMALVSATLALGAKVFDNVDKNASRQYLAKAEQLWLRAQKDDVLDYYPYDQPWFYNDLSVDDNMALAAAELYKATNKTPYLDAAEKYTTAFGAKNYTSWETYSLAANVRLKRDSKRASMILREDMDYFWNFANSSIDTETLDDGNIWGRAMKPVWAGLYNALHVGGVAGELSLYGNQQYVDLMYDNLDFMLGRNNWGVSFLATTRTPYSVKNIYSQIYSIQSDIFPVGAVAEGPVTRESQAQFIKWMGNKDKILESLRTSKFNTESEVFVDDNTDFTCMETTIYGQSTAIYLIAANYAYERSKDNSFMIPLLSTMP